MKPPMNLKRKPRLKKSNISNPEVYFDIIIEHALAGRIVFELFDDVVPVTADNFRSLCTGERGKGAHTYKPLTYKHTKFHKIIRDFMIQGGDFVRGDGYGSDSAYGRTFADESFVGKAGKFDHRGVLAMAKATDGDHTNSCQFFIALKPLPWLNGKHVVFGQVVEGFEVLDAIEDIAEHDSGKTWNRVHVYDCGELEFTHHMERLSRRRRRAKRQKAWELAGNTGPVPSEEALAAEAKAKAKAAALEKAKTAGAGAGAGTARGSKGGTTARSGKQRTAR